LVASAVERLYKARKARKAHPQGKQDKQGRWYPSDAEDADGFTANVRSPSAAWPWSYMTAARTKKHIKALAAVNPAYVLHLAGLA
jgi:hypothetical protein